MIKHLEENIIVNLHGLGSSNGYLDMTTKAQVTKEKINWTLSKSKTFASKGIIKKVKRQPHRIEEIMCKSHVIPLHTHKHS